VATVGRGCIAGPREKHGVLSAEKIKKQWKRCKRLQCASGAPSEWTYK